jgi:membrane-associated protease RseP (regulator of RpoE activity)
MKVFGWSNLIKDLKHSTIFKKCGILVESFFIGEGEAK